jgi:ankyrin repeat protein
MVAAETLARSIACLRPPFAPTPAYPSLAGSLAEAAERLSLDLLAGLASQDGWTPLHAAAKGGHSKVVDRLIAARAMVDTANKVVLRCQG